MSSRMTAMDIESQAFHRKLRGYDPEEVDLFLTSVSDEETLTETDVSDLLDIYVGLAVSNLKAKAPDNRLEV